MRTRALTVAAVAVAAAGCTRDASDSAAERAIEFSVVVDTGWSADGAVFTRPADMVVHASGEVAVLEYSPASIVTVDPASGAVTRRMGGPGAGPGELNTPLGLLCIGDTLLTLNAGNQRIERDLADGTVLPSRRAPVGFGLGRFAFTADGGMLIPMAGADSTLLRVLDADGALVRRVGKPRAPFDRRWDVVAFRALADQLQVPEYYANDVLAAATPDSIYWLAFNAFPEIIALRPSGDTVAAFRLPDSVAAPILLDYRERNRAEKDPRRFQQLLYFADLRISGPYVWALLRNAPAQDARAFVLDTEGTLVADITFVGASDVWRIAPDLASGVVYLTSATASELYRARLPAALVR